MLKITQQEPWWTLLLFSLSCSTAAPASWLVLTCQVRDIWKVMCVYVSVWTVQEYTVKCVLPTRWPEEPQLLHPARHHHSRHLHLHHLQPAQRDGGLYLWTVCCFRLLCIFTFTRNTIFICCNAFSYIINTYKPTKSSEMADNCPLIHTHPNRVIKLTSANAAPWL